MHPTSLSMPHQDKQIYDLIFKVDTPIYDLILKVDTPLIKVKLNNDKKEHLCLESWNQVKRASPSNYFVFLVGIKYLSLWPD